MASRSVRQQLLRRQLVRRRAPLLANNASRPTTTPPSTTLSLRAPYHTRLHALVMPSASASSSLRVLRASRRWQRPNGQLHLHMVPVRNAGSFARVLPKLAVKLLRIPAMFGAAMIGAVAWIQYQATQAGNYASDVWRKGSAVATSFAGTAYDGVTGVASQVKTGWDRTKEDVGGVEMPAWLTEMITSKDGGSKSGKSGGSDPKQEPPKQGRSGTATAAGAGVAAGAATQSTNDDEEQIEHQAARDDQMMMLTKKMIEIRTILQEVGQSGSLILPSIVVIGSQSSGKSSVLEAIVGHEFLPKGSNMITRRPIELTLVNTPEKHAEYGEFPALGLGKITDFAQIQRTLTDLNLAVPAEQCVSDDPIQLTISSPNVPDLSLIDLPGYIQIAGMDQPSELKQKIADLCDKYIQAPNVILAISAADVDLANSTALRASRRVDPRGERTIGVITKMDLVDPQRGASMLDDRKYPLRLGYVGVVSRVPPQTGLFSRGSGNIATAITKNENAYFSSHPLEYGTETGLAVGTSTLRKKLMHVLQQTMAASLKGTTDAVSQELEEATYEFKVQYNDRPLSAETYLAESLDTFKHSFKELTEKFGRPQVREMLKAELDQHVLDLLAQRYWNKPITDLSDLTPDPEPLASLPKSDPESLFWHRKLDASVSALTKLGIGRLATNVLANALQEQVDRLIGQSTFASHPFAQQAIAEASSGILNDRFYSTSDQVENCIKPYKFEIEIDDTEWAKGRQSIAKVLKRELAACETAMKQAEDGAGGRRKLKDVMAFIERVRTGEIKIDGEGTGGAGGFSAALLAKGREALFLSDRAGLITLRLAAIKSRQCSSRSNKYYCPEIFLDAVADKLTSTAVLFLNVELLSEFYYNFPRELDSRLGGPARLSRDDIERFAREDKKVAQHLDVIRRRDTLELALRKMESLRGLDGITGDANGEQQNTSSKDRRRGARGGSKDSSSSGWRLF